ncbi:MAG: hypothetical protein ACR2IP_02495 [Solirubrobacteraceae bacterium]
MTRLLNHARSNAIAYLALGVSMLALAGGAYAAISLPPGSVGARQIRNGAVQPAKLDHSSISGYVRHWAEIRVPGKIIAASPGARAAGTSAVVFRQTGPMRHCIALSSASQAHIGSTLFAQSATLAQVSVGINLPQGRVSVAVIC